MHPQFAGKRYACDGGEKKNWKIITICIDGKLGAATTEAWTMVNIM